jgi:hypothetical protein
MESHEGADGGQTKQNISISTGSQESLATCDASVKLQAPSNHPPAGKDDSRDIKNTEEQDTNSKKRTAGEYSLEPFDWKDFETRYTSAMSKMNELEAALHKEFGELMSVGRLIPPAKCPTDLGEVFFNMGNGSPSI